MHRRRRRFYAIGSNCRNSTRRYHSAAHRPRSLPRSIRASGLSRRNRFRRFSRAHPPLGTPVEESNWQETSSSTRVGEIVADDSSLQIDRSSTDQPLLFVIHTLRLYSVSDKRPASFTVSLHIPVPPGDVRAQGQFGPWNYTDSGQTPVAGAYTFQNADLEVFPGIAGILSAQDKFQGVLGTSIRREASTFRTSWSRAVSIPSIYKASFTQRWTARMAMCN